MVCSIRVDSHRLRLFLPVPYGAQLSSSHLLETFFFWLFVERRWREDVSGWTTRRGTDERLCLDSENWKSSRDWLVKDWKLLADFESFQQFIFLEFDWLGELLRATTKTSKSFQLWFAFNQKKLAKSGKKLIWGWNKLRCSCEATASFFEIKAFTQSESF